MPIISYKEMLVIAVVVDIALHGGSSAANAKQLADRHRLPPRHLEPFLQALAQAGILASARGSSGGYKLAREPGRISAEDVLLATRTLEDEEDVGCSQLNEVVTRVLRQPLNSFRDELSRITIEDLMAMAARDAA
jgi:Rrf2 family protein